MAHAFYQLTQVRSSIRAEGVARMAKVMKVDSCQPGCRDGWEPDAPAEVAVMQRLATRAGEDQIAIAGRGELIQVTNDVGGTMVAGMITVRRPALDFGGPKSSPPPGSGVSDRSILTVHAARSRSSRRNADSSTRQPERFTVSFTAPGTIDCGTFEDQFTDFLRRCRSYVLRFSRKPDPDRRPLGASLKRHQLGHRAHAARAWALHRDD